MSKNLEYITTHHDELIDSFDTGITSTYEFRYGQLEKILQFIDEIEEICNEALNKDLHKPQLEVETTEILPVRTSLLGKMKMLKSFMEPKKVSTSALCLPAHSYIQYEPLGTVLIIGPFNFPYQLLLNPLIDAIAAGNTVMCKPSELTNNITRVLMALLPKYLDSRCFRIVEGGIDTSTKLLSLQWDFIFFTGSTRVGKIVHQAAANYLTPVCLELGGKSPVYVDESCADLVLAARRICWGKMGNAGQACIAPDYVMVHEKVYDAFLIAVKNHILNFYNGKPKESSDFGRIISEQHTMRLKKILDSQSGDILIGGDSDISERYIEPTVLKNVTTDSFIMEEEIFGPILPTMPVKDVDHAIKIIKNIPGKPLALYPFAHDKKVVDKLIARVSSGGVTVNDTLIHFATYSVPFGGVGASGMGAYHGEFSFETFSHKRSIVVRWDHWLGDVTVRYPPFTDFNRKLFRFLMAFGGLEFYSFSLIPIMVLTLVVGMTVGAGMGYFVQDPVRASQMITNCTDNYLVPAVRTNMGYFSQFIFYVAEKTKFLKNALE